MAASIFTATIAVMSMSIEPMMVCVTPFTVLNSVTPLTPSDTQFSVYTALSLFTSRLSGSTGSGAALRMVTLPRRQASRSGDADDRGICTSVLAMTTSILGISVGTMSSCGFGTMKRRFRLAATPSKFWMMFATWSSPSAFVTMYCIPMFFAVSTMFSMICVSSPCGTASSSGRLPEGVSSAASPADSSCSPSISGPFITKFSTSCTKRMRTVSTGAPMLHLASSEKPG